MALKIAVIGAGSLGFTRGLMRDMLAVPELQDTKIAFMDIKIFQRITRFQQTHYFLVVLGFGGGKTDVFDSAVTAGFIKNIKMIIPAVVEELEIDFSVAGIGGHLFRH